MWYVPADLNEGYFQVKGSKQDAIVKEQEKLLADIYSELIDPQSFYGTFEEALDKYEKKKAEIEALENAGKTPSPADYKELTKYLRGIVQGGNDWKEKLLKHFGSDASKPENKAILDKLDALKVALLACEKCVTENLSATPPKTGGGGPAFFEDWEVNLAKCVYPAVKETFGEIKHLIQKNELSYYVILRAFIPQDKIEMPKAFGIYFVPSGLFYGVAYHRGDDRREYLLDPGKKYRTEHFVFIDFLKKKHSESKMANGSEGLDKNEKVVVRSESTTDCGSINMSFYDDYKSAKVNFEIAAVNKAEIKAQMIFPITPNINAKVVFSITPQQDNSFDYKVYIPEMDGFPAYEMWVYDNKNDKSYLIFRQNPIESGENPLSLFGDGEHSYQYNGNSKNLISGKKFTFSEMKNLTEK